MFTVSGFGLPSGALAALLLAGGAAVAGEKANITPASGTKPPANIGPAKSSEVPFRPLDGSSSIGGVVDDGAGLPSVAPAPPDARTQKQAFERLDRQRNFLLVDPGDKTATDDRQSFEESGDTGENPKTVRRPQTALERRLKSGSRTSATEAAGREAERKQGRGRDSEASGDSSDLARPAGAAPAGLFGDETRAGRTSLTEGGGFSSPASPANLLEPATVQDLRSALSAAGGRGLGLDSLSRERIERYQQSIGAGDSLRRGMAPGAADFGRSRELRSDAVETMLAPPSAAVRSDLNPLAASENDPGLAVRSTGLASPFSGVMPNVYAPPAGFAAPPPAPAASFLKDPRPEPPRFHP